MTRADGPAPTATSGYRLVRSWVVWTTGAEVVGFLVPATVGVLTVDAGLPLALPLLLLAGAAEGFVLGAAQAHVLTSALPRLPRLRWAAATSGAAALAWLIGLSPAATEHVWRSWPLAVRLACAVMAGAVLLASIGVAQWWVLRDHLPRAYRWVGITAVAWLAGLTAFMLIASPLWHEGQSTAVVVAIGALAGLVMAGVVATVTGFGLRSLLAGDPT
jgi:hypothetical protein